MNASKRQSMKRAVRIYLDLAYIKELLRVVGWRKNSGKWYQQRGLLQLYERKLKRILKKKMPTHQDVISLGEKTKEVTQTTIPDWFKKTKLCFHWYATGDGGQCGGAKNLLCAQVNYMTSSYRDDTDWRGGGCMMRWKIESSRYDAWFNAVKICFNAYPTGSGRGQCNNGASYNHCKPINSYTPYYRDDTDRRWGGCRMRWKLSVPYDAPLWMHKAKICFRWSGPSGQCGGGVPSYMCANANSWTQAYRDDTDRRSGACRMSWGIKI